MIVWGSSCKRFLKPVRLLKFQKQLSQLSPDSQRIRISDLLEIAPSGEGSLDVIVAGFIRSIRKQKQITFASLGDGSTVNPLQAVFSPDQSKELSIGAAVLVRGKWISSPATKKNLQTHELVADQVEVQGDNDASTYPIQKKYHTPDFLRTLPHLRVRTPHSALLLRLRSQIIADATNFFVENRYTQTHPPIITSSDCEGAGEVFTVDVPGSKSAAAPERLDTRSFFGSPKYLTVSSQLHLEALAQSVGKVWTLSPTFRAERSDTSRHLSEFYMLEAEIAFTHTLDEIMDVVENLIRHLASRLKNSKVGEELLQDRVDLAVERNTADLSKRWDSLISSPWPRVKYHDICARLSDAAAKREISFDTPPDSTSGFQTEHEKFIAEDLFHGPVFVTDYPQSVKPFYMAPSGLDSEAPAIGVGTIPTVSCFDLLLPEVCEVAGGSIREHRLKSLQNVMERQGLLGTQDARGVVNEEPNSENVGFDDESGSNLEWYLDLRRYGSVPHGGFGLGFDRLLGFLAGVSSIRDVVTFPRHYNRCIT